jgi:hypothetical protein
MKPTPCRTNDASRRDGTVAANRQNRLARLVDGLHDSRRLYAARIIRDSGAWLNSQLSKDLQSSQDLKAQRIERPGFAMPLNTKLLLAAIVVGFGILHVVGGTKLQRAPGQAPIENALPSDHGD